MYTVPVIEEEEDNGPPMLEILPHIIVYIKEHKTSKGTETFLKSVADLYLFYTMVIKMTNFNDSKELETFTKKLTSEDNSDDEKIKTVFQWVQKNVKYVGITEGWGGFVPNDCVDVFHNRYGDCKAMANLTSQMLKSVDVNSHLTWIGTSVKPYTYTNNFTPSTDNHMILTVYKNNEPQILDPTYSYGAINYPPFYLQGKEALIALTDSTYQVYEVPVMPKEMNRAVDSTYLMLINGSLLGSSYIHLTGYKKNEHEVELKNTKSKLDEFYIEQFNRGNNTALTNLKMFGNLDRSDRLDINYDMKLNDYIKKFGDKYYLNMNIDKKFAGMAIDTKNRKYDYLFDYCFEDESVLFFMIPDGFQVEYLPDEHNYRHDKFGFSTNYSIENETVRMKRLFYINDIRILTSDFEEWNAMINQLSTAFQEVLIISKN